MKIRVYKGSLVRLVNWYDEQLKLKFGAYAVSEATKELVRRELANLQMRKMATEMTEIWKIPVSVEFDNNGLYQVVPDMERILILDFDR